MKCCDDDNAGAGLILVLCIGGCIVFGCCNNQTQKNMPTSAPITVPDGMLLTRDLAGQTGAGKYTFEIFKVDLPQGSFGLKDGLLHKYAGHTVWNNIDSDFERDPWLKALKSKLQEMRDKHLVCEEGVVYKPDGNVDDK